MTVSKDAANRYFVSIFVEAEVEPKAQVESNIGIALGLAGVGVPYGSM